MMTDTATDGYPEVLNRFRCDWVEDCKTAERQLLVFADVDGETKLLHSWSGVVSRYGYECDLIQNFLFTVAKFLLMIAIQSAILVFVGRFLWRWFKRKRE